MKRKSGVTFGMLLLLIFGYKVVLVYKCGLQPKDAKPPAYTQTRFVTTLGLVF